MPPERKPLARMESAQLEGRTLRGPDSMWAAVDRGAWERGLEPAEFGRHCLLMGLMFARNPHLLEAAVRILASVHVADLAKIDALSRESVQHPQRTHGMVPR